MPTPTNSDRYAVVHGTADIQSAEPGQVIYWRDADAVIGLMTMHANTCWRESQNFSVWHRRTARSEWKSISLPISMERQCMSGK